MSRGEVGRESEKKRECERQKTRERGRERREYVWEIEKKKKRVGKREYE